MTRTLLRVTGTVQGVGFRPFVYRHAVALGLAGSVRNDSAGVLIDVEGEPERIAELTRVLAETRRRWRASRRSRGSTRCRAASATASRIVESDAAGAPSVPVSVDTATCDECLAEVDDPADRRYRYPFTNCTNCGPRYTIMLARAVRPPGDDDGRLRRCARPAGPSTTIPSTVASTRNPTRARSAGRSSPGATPPARALADGDDALTAAVDALRAGAIVGGQGHRRLPPRGRRHRRPPRSASCGAARRATTSRSR